jgi:hypothetical protein
MSLTGGKRKVNKSLKAWVAFVKKVQKEEKLSYKDAIHRAKVRKDKGEKWMTGGQTVSSESDAEMDAAMDVDNAEMDVDNAEMELDNAEMEEDMSAMGGKRKRKSMRKSGRSYVWCTKTRKGRGRPGRKSLRCTTSRRGRRGGSRR